MAAFAALPPLRAGFIRLLLVRHGESLGNQRHILDNSANSSIDSLTETGRAQAAALGAALRDLPILPEHGDTFVGSSSMSRAIETADIVAQLAFCNAVRMQPSVDLVELGNGKLDGCFMHEVMDELKAVSLAWRNGDIDMQVGETGDSPKMLQERATRGLSSMFDALPAEASAGLIVAHFWVNRVLLALWTDRSLSQIGEIQQPNAGLSVVDVKASDVRIADVHIIGWGPPVEDPDKAL
jgi:broad specificity phosphatase PhoE